LSRRVIDAGIIRLQPVLITVGATVLALFPLAMHGGPPWQPLRRNPHLGHATYVFAKPRSMDSFLAL